jgi:spectinomycin phosphotransferase
VTDNFEDVANSGDDRLRAWLREDFGVQLSSIDRVGHGADAAAEVWRGIAVDGTQYAVKRSGGGTDAGPLLTAHLAAIGVPGILGPTKTRSGQVWSEREGRRLSLAPWISADRALDGGMTAQRWTSYGALLAKVHATKPTPALGAALPREHYSNDRMAALSRTIDRRLRTAAPADALEEELATTWKASYEVIAGLLELSDELGRKLPAEDAPVVICHADPHLGNVLVGPANEAWLIDWDDAVLAPREQDLMFVLGGMGEFGP